MKPLSIRCAEAADAIVAGGTIFSDQVHGLLVEASERMGQLERCHGCGKARADFDGICARTLCPWGGER